MNFIIIKRRINIWIYDQPPSPLCQDVSLHCFTPRRALTAVNSEINRFILQSYLSCMPCPHCVASQKYSENPKFRGLRPITVMSVQGMRPVLRALCSRGRAKYEYCWQPALKPYQYWFSFAKGAWYWYTTTPARPGHNRKYRTVPVCITRPSSVHSFCGLSVAVMVGDK